MPENNNYDCIHEELLQDHSLGIQELKTRSNFKEQRLDNLERKMEEMDKKLDKISENIQESQKETSELIQNLQIKSYTDDTQLELRLKEIETRQDAQEKARKSDNEKNMRILTAVSVILGLLTFYFNYLRH